VEKDELKAVEWYHRAAKQGLAAAQSNLALMCALGKGVQQDYKVEFGWCRLGAKQGDARGEDTLGVMYENGWGGGQSRGGHHLVSQSGRARRRRGQTASAKLGDQTVSACARLN
jgi:TPR repeat protein